MKEYICTNHFPIKQMVPIVYGDVVRYVCPICFGTFTKVPNEVM